VLSGIRRQHGIRPIRKAAPLELDPLARLLEPIDTSTLGGLRDRMLLLLLGFAAAMRRSELVALDVEDLSFDAGRGLLVMIGRAKSDQEPARERRSQCPTRRLQTAAQSGRCAATSTPPRSIADPYSGRCAAATTSPTAASQTSRSR
jgi:integrase